MRVSKPDDPSLIETQALDAMLLALNEKPHELKTDDVIRLDAALHALRNGFSLIEIVSRAVCQLEKSIIARALAVSDGNKSQAARLLQIDYKTLYRHLHK